MPDEETLGQQNTEQPPVESPEAGKAGAPEQPTQPSEAGYITPAKLEEILSKRDEQLAVILNKRDEALLHRAGRSATARAKNEIAAYRRGLDAQKAAGFEVTPQQQQAVEDQIIRASIVAEESVPLEQGRQEAKPVPQQSSEDAWVQTLLAKQQAVFIGAGVEVVPGDPEYKAIEDEWNNPRSNEDQYLKVAATQAKAKAARLAKEAETATVRSPGGGAGQSAKPNPIANINDTSKLYEMGDDQIRKGKR